ncbi:MAG TPA: ABC transporter substrate-binding protein [Nevskiaceae bacterium]|nr:ABC transporter substrate-binding protein [Nevskiaceae bacterium]
MRLTFALLLFAPCVVALAIAAPDQAIRDTNTQFLAQIDQHRDEFRRDRARFDRMVDQVVVPRFDIPYIGRLVLGREWKSASDAQRSRFLAAFKNSLVHEYAHALLDYGDGLQEQWHPLQAAPGAGDVTVHMDLSSPQAAPLQVGFAAHRVNDDWKVYDVTVNGISLAASFRAQFAVEIALYGLDGVIQRLESGGPPLQIHPGTG